MPEHDLTRTTPMDFDPVVTEPTPVTGPTVPDAKLRYIIIPEEDIKAYITGGSFRDKNFKCESKYNLLGLSAVEISDSLLETIRPQLGRSFEEITKDEFYFGTVHFAEIRDTVKVLKTGDGVIWDWTPAIPDEHWKQAIDFSQEMKDFTLSFMKKYAKEIIENEYSKKLKFIKNVSELESATWEIQKHEAREFLTYGEDDPAHVTPFLDYIATERSFDKTTLSNKILEKAEEYQDRLSTMLVKSQKILKKVEVCTTIWDLNIVYEDYFGIMMPTEQAETLKRVDPGIKEDGEIDYNRKGNRMAFFNTDTNEKTTEDDPKAKWLPDPINPYMGNKLNF
tara:strand:- start:1806 stop:2816 length:1011 start_codon:yes stop_codon:yes gene_type:complete